MRQQSLMHPGRQQLQPQALWAYTAPGRGNLQLQLEGCQLRQHVLCWVLWTLLQRAAWWVPYVRMLQGAIIRGALFSATWCSSAVCGYVHVNTGCGRYLCAYSKAR